MLGMLLYSFHVAKCVNCTQQHNYRPWWMLPKRPEFYLRGIKAPALNGQTGPFADKEHHLHRDINL